MPGDAILPQWAPRLPQDLIRRLYETDARGIYDDELLDEAGWALLHRCRSFIEVAEAVNGSVTCPACGQAVRRERGADEMLRCAACGWSLPWRAYLGTFRHRQLSGAEPVLVLFRDFIRGFQSARSPQEKMLQIDRLIHGFHRDLRDRPTRTTGINLIEGNYHEVVDFLDRLTYGEGSTPGTRETRQEWRRTINDTAEAWGDERLRREGE
ncbi:MAG: hypothetical protein ACYC5O_16980 [Anaerolineae bacterium]